VILGGTSPGEGGVGAGGLLVLSSLFVSRLESHDRGFAHARANDRCGDKVVAVLLLG